MILAPTDTTGLNIQIRFTYLVLELFIATLDLTTVTRFFAQ